MQTTVHRNQRRGMRSSAPLGLLLAVLVGAVGAVGVIRAADARTADVVRIEGLEDVLVAQDGPAVNYLLIGSDSREGVSGSDADFGSVGDTSVVQGRRSDTIMILRQEEDGNGAALVSLHRDLWVTIAGRGSQNRINAAYNEGPGVLAATISEELGIPINHVVDVDFLGFKDLVDAAGGTVVCFEYATRDANSGLEQQPGCNQLDGVQALAYARSRNFEEFREGEWRKDPTADLGRIARQQTFIATTVDATLQRLQSDPFIASELISSVSQSVRLDPGLDPIGAAGTLRKAFSSGFTTYQLDVSGTTIDGKSVLVLEPGSEPILNYFRGLGPLPPSGDRPRRLGCPAMKALILAGGAGTRLRPITHTRAKQLVPVANMPILFYGIESIVAAGITELGVIVGDTRDEIRSALGDGSRFGARITYIPQDEPLGLAHCVLIAREFLADDEFVMYLGDNLLEQDLAAFVGSFARARGGDQPPSAQILLKKVPDPHRFGIAELDNANHVVHLVEKPDDPPSDLALVGVYLFDEHIHDAVSSIEPSARGELEITDAIQWLIDNGHRVRTEILTGWWIDTGKLTPLLEANRLILETITTRIDGSVDADSALDGRVVVEAGAQICNSTIRGPVAIGANTRIIDSFIGPFSAVGADCHVEHSEIEHSVIMNGSRVIDIPRLEDSLIGSDAVVSRTRRKPRAVRLMVGDHCLIDVE